MRLTTKQYVDNQIHWLKIYQEAENRAIRMAVDKVENTNKEATDKLEKTNTQKFEAQNEWRGQYKDQTATFLTRREFWGGVLAIGIALVALYFKR